MNIGDTNIDTVREFVNALEANDWELTTSYLTDDFLFSGWTPKPLHKQGFLAVFTNLKKGIPGLMFNLHNVQDLDDTTVTATQQVSGYQTDSFTLPPLGTPLIPLAASSISLPAEDVTFLLQQGKIAALNIQQIIGGGVQGLLRQLGTDVPILQ